MIVTLLPLIALLVSCFVLMLGFGLIGILLPVRLGLEGMAADRIGLILSMYAVGMLLGGLYSRRLIVRVGHIRVFSASAALSAVAILACSLSMSEWLWGLMRMLMGFCIACAFAVIDGWLSEAASGKTRGKVLAINQVVVMGALFAGQFLLNAAPPTGQNLFILAGILLCLALLPLILSRQSGPHVSETQGMSFVQLLHISPLGVVGCFFGGMLYGGLLNMLPVFAGHYQITGFELSLYMACAILGAFVLQFPVGMLSDRLDRRSLLFTLLVINVAFTLLVPFSAQQGSFTLLLLATGVITGVFSCLYPMSISETFDRVPSSKIAAAMGGLLSIYALGSILGPLASSIAMQRLGHDALFGFLAVSQVLLLGFILYRMRARQALPIQEQESFVIQQPSVATAFYELDPRLHLEDEEEPLSLEAQVAVTIAESSPAAAVSMAKEIALSSPEKAAELCAALAHVDDIDVARLYRSITRVAPDLSLEIADALTSSAPEEAAELVSWLARTQPHKLADMVAALARQLSDNADAPASVQADEGMRPADREALQESATELVSHFAEHQPEQAIEIAAAVVETLPEVASDVVDILHDADQVDDQQLISDLDERPPLQNHR